MHIYTFRREIMLSKISIKVYKNEGWQQKRNCDYIKY